MKRTSLISILILIFGAGHMLASFGQDYYVAAYGAKGDGITNDTEAIRAAVTALTKNDNEATLHFQAGKVYRCEGGGGLIDIEDTKNKTILGNGVTILMEPRVLGIRVEGCENILVQDLTFDTDPMTFTQGVVTAVDKANRKFTMEIENGYPMPTNTYSDAGRPNNWGMLWGGEDDDIKEELIFILSCGTPNGRQVEFTVRNDMADKLDRFVVGTDRFTVDVVGIGGSLSSIKTSKDVTFKNIDNYAARSLNYVINENTGRVTLDGVNIRRKPGTTRLLSGYRDGFHCKKNKVGPIIQNCYIEGVCDDAINLSGGYYYVTGKSSDTRFTLDAAANFSVGDTLHFVDMEEGKNLGITTIAAVSGTVVTTADPIAGVSAGAAKAETTTYVMNLSLSNNDFIVRNNTFYNHRRYAMLIRCRNGLIENNTGSKISAGIMLVNEVGNFYEGPFPANIRIEGNSFTDIRCQGFPLFVDAKTYNKARIDQLITNITIKNNTFGPSLAEKQAAIFNDASGITLVNNNFVSLPGVEGLSFNNCSDIHLICENTFNDQHITSVDDAIKYTASVPLTEFQFTADCPVSGISDDYSAPSDMSLYYSQGCITIETDVTDYQVNVYSTSGALMLTEPNASPIINISQLPVGVYLVNVEYQGIMFTYKIVK